MTGRRMMRWNVVLNVRAIYPSGQSFAGCWEDMRGGEARAKDGRTYVTSVLQCIFYHKFP